MDFQFSSFLKNNSQNSFLVPSMNRTAMKKTIGRANHPSHSNSKQHINKIVNGKSQKNRNGTDKGETSNSVTYGNVSTLGRTRKQRDNQQQQSDNLDETVNTVDTSSKAMGILFRTKFILTFWIFSKDEGLQLPPPPTPNQKISLFIHTYAPC